MNSRVTFNANNKEYNSIFILETECLDNDYSNTDSTIEWKISNKEFDNIIKLSTKNIINNMDKFNQFINSVKNKFNSEFVITSKNEELTISYRENKLLFRIYTLGSEKNNSNIIFKCECNEQIINSLNLIKKMVEIVITSKKNTTNKTKIRISDVTESPNYKTKLNFGPDDNTNIYETNIFDKNEFINKFKNELKSEIEKEIQSKIIFEVIQKINKQKEFNQTNFNYLNKYS